MVFSIDFPASEAGRPYRLLASRAGTGPSKLGGIAVPLTHDVVLDRLLQGWAPPPTAGFAGILDATVHAHASLASGPTFVAYLGRTAHFAAVSCSPPGDGRLSSIARSVTVVP